MPGPGIAREGKKTVPTSGTLTAARPSPMLTILFRPASLARWLITLGCLALLTACSPETAREPGRVHFVRISVQVPGDGTSWDQAFAHPQDALDVARSGDQVWVAQGAYGPRSPGDGQLLTLRAGVIVMGGFGGHEADVDERDLGLAATLDGEGAVDHVVVGADGAVLDGFIVTGGVADGQEIDGVRGGSFSGGGMINLAVSPQVRNVHFLNNRADFNGGAVYNEDNAALFLNCIFEGSRAMFGGAVENFRSAAEYINCIFRDNASLVSGGAVMNLASSPAFVNGLFEGNRAQHLGGAVYSNDSPTVLINASVSGNIAGDSAGAVGAYRTSVHVANCILWDNAAADGSELAQTEGTMEVIYSIVKGGHPGTANMDLSPGFLRPGHRAPDDVWVAGDYRLVEGSPAIDSGAAKNAPNFDLLDQPRPQSLAHDRGAYEHPARP